ncbi:ribonuclease H-like domain-containing protein, partial [Tanacetum coccineum]
MKENQKIFSNPISKINHFNFFDTPYVKSSSNLLPNDDSEANNDQGSDSLSDNISLYSDSGATHDDLVITSSIDNNIVDHNSTSEGNNFNIQNVVNEPITQRRPERTSKLPTKLFDFVLDNKVKYGIDRVKSNGDIERHKAKLVAKGYNQREGVDYDETFSLIVKIVTVRCLINIAVNNGWPLFQLDVNNAFLYGNLTEEVYMTLPPGYFSVNDQRFCKVLKNENGICLSQRKYRLELLSEYGLLACKPSQTPIESKLIVGDKPTNKKDKYLKNITEYQKPLGKLIYLTHTRLGISYVVHSLSQFMHSSLESHLKLGFKILRYLKQSPGKGIMISKGNNMNLCSYSDSDYAKYRIKRRFVTGFAIFMGNSLISWKSKKHFVVSRSSVEAEYGALASATCEVIWLTNLLQDLNIKIQKPITMFCGNKATIQIASNPVFYDRNKHFEIDLHFIRDKMIDGIIKPTKIDSANNNADILTKGLAVDQHMVISVIYGMHYRRGWNAKFHGQRTIVKECK